LLSLQRVPQAVLPMLVESPLWPREASLVRVASLRPQRAVRLGLIAREVLPPLREAARQAPAAPAAGLRPGSAPVEAVAAPVSARAAAGPPERVALARRARGLAPAAPERHSPMPAAHHSTGRARDRARSHHHRHRDDRYASCRCRK
jgi:hypothetical protein